MKYGLKRNVLGAVKFIEISFADYTRIRVAHKSLIEFLFLEREYDFVCENYYEYEREMISSTVRYLLFRDQRGSWIDKERETLGRRIFNFLSSCRMYLDQRLHNVSNVYGSQSEKISTIQKERKRVYDAHLAFRFVEELRNYTQHRGFPIQSISFSSQFKDEKLTTTTKPIIILSELKKDKKFKQSIVEEMTGPRVDLKPLTREYMECLSGLHNHIRTTCAKEISGWEDSMLGVVDMFKEGFGSSISSVGISLVRQSDAKQIEEQEDLFIEAVSRRKDLVLKNSSLKNLRRLRVTNE